MARRDLFDRRTLITGASSGIGRALALELAGFRGQLVLVARREASLHDVADQVRRRGGDATILAGDVVDPVTRAGAIRAATEQFGGLDILVNNAGVTAHGRFAEANPQRLQRILDVNFVAAAEFIRDALPLLTAGNDPAVVNIGSILGHRGIPHNSEYCASKFALRGFSQALRPELMRVGVELLIVSPGTTDTELFDSALERRGELPWSTSAGVSAEQVARATAVALRQRNPEVIPSFRGKWLIWLNRFLPTIVDRWMLRYG